ncbi:MAG: RnfABCDGE type electron transport complex subunit D [Treponema sp.]|nr:RnfABCDGE type electron transport complex subunit D [Treponema sp.]
MSETNTNEIYLSASPHFTQGKSTRKIMATVLISLLPECVYSVVLFGIHAFVLLLVSVASCIGFEALFQKVTKQKMTVDNLSAAVTGVLLALVLSSTVPVWTVVLGAAVAMIVAKGLFGGIGANVFNPALTGRGFLFISFGSAMSMWLNPASGANKLSWSLTGASNVDAISQATALSHIKAGTFVADSGTYLQFLFGNRAGCMGETAIALIMLSFVFLLVTKIIDWRAPVAMVGTVALCTFAASLAGGTGVSGACADTLLALLSGGLLFGATFMVTDYATTPVTQPGRLLFGFGCGLITFLIRKFGGYPEGVMFSILIMNAVAPFLNHLTARKYGYGKRARHCDIPGADGAKPAAAQEVNK